ncbi:MAG: hypothetical protein IJL09_03825 [Lachnospiraceae bacterium]|nr:hypothetical protein [Lachnospiraceae bacterium]
MTFQEMNRKLGEILADSGVILYREIVELLSQTDENKGITLEKIVMDKGYANEDKMVLAKSALFGIPYCDFDVTEFLPEVTKLVNREQALQYCCIPFGYNENSPSELMIVTDDPTNYKKAEALKKVTGSNVRLIFGAHSRILKKIDELYPGPKTDEKEETPIVRETVVTQPASEVKASGTASQPKDNRPAIERFDVSEEWAHSGIIRAGDFYYLSYCVGNIGGTIDEQINGAFDHMEKRLKLVGLTLDNVIQMDCLFRDIWNIPVMEKIIKERFKGKYPVRKSIQTEFAHVGGKEGLQFQVDGIAYAPNK